jgi:hypothetical protein
VYNAIQLVLLAQIMDLLTVSLVNQVFYFTMDLVSIYVTHFYQDIPIPQIQVSVLIVQAIATPALISLLAKAVI